MTKETVIRMREDFSTSPLKITCDNMIIVWDNSPNYPKVIWDDDNEELTILRSSTEDIQQGYPFEILKTTYDHIQYIEAYVSPQTATQWLLDNKDAIGEEEYDRCMKLISQTISKRSYTGTVEMRNILK